MSRYSKKQKASVETEETAMKIAKSRQRPGQTKEQTKLIAEGIKKGIDEYKRQQKAKQREMDKQRKRKLKGKEESEPLVEEKVVIKQHWLPWGLLIISWIAFAAYLT